MKRLKQCMILGMALLWSCLFLGTALGEVSLAGAESTYDRVFDLADLFTDQEEQELSETIGRLTEKMGMDLAVVTAEEAHGYTGQKFADTFYNENGLGTGKDHSGALLLIDMDNREIAVSTEGRMLRYMTDVRIETILDDVYDQVSDGNFFGGARVFLKDAETCFDNGIASDQFNEDTETGKISRYRHLAWYEILFAVSVAGACGLAAVAAVVRDYGMKGKDVRMAANFRLSYRKDSAFSLGNTLADVMLGSYVTQRIITTARNSGGGGRSGGGGLSGGGRTSTHRTGGRVHGGGSRKF